jgi:hypothetical protein
MDWLQWHRDYDDPTSSHSARLVVVRRCIGEALDELGPGCRRIVSLCAGDGRDVLPELAVRPTSAPEVLLVELEPSLARDAAENAAGLGLGTVLVAEADAGDTAVFADALPCDLLLLCGIFGNIADGDIRATLAAVPAMVRPGGFVVWTRGWFAHADLRPEVRRWSVDAGLEEVAYEGEPAQYGVGLYRRPAGAPVAPLPARLFTFIR